VRKQRVASQSGSSRPSFVLDSLYELTPTNFFIIPSQALAGLGIIPPGSGLALNRRDWLLSQAPIHYRALDTCAFEGDNRAIKKRRSLKKRRAPRGSASTRNSNQNIESRVAEAQLSPALRICLAGPASGWPDAICKGVTPSRQNNDFQLQAPRSGAALTFP